ncbi:toxin-antitoxin system YwqK family antitoxin [Pontibacter sp. JH31]|uniref:Toxin-antitoxin system YwqK family antitoxin n=1 Tax=Pontibacter aquaedesilientis TaxID=2766980 RepID=A0ABR7XHE5_9BACT|nr:toxin-antitoxin system YwqK family antitoxin [Pontibacter aquaedesilientis]MBD1397688.1 toxin-antitoxin system YwqK family antitoxin [Pontibacter aquaedesilientis]
MAKSPTVLLDKNATPLRLDNGLLLVKGKPFSGKLYTLFESSTDTAEFISYQNGKEHGEWKKFYPSGQLRERRFFEQGQKTGEYIAWWENGKKQLHYFFEEDEYEGACKEWNEDGRLVKAMHYKNGHEEGPQQLWYDNGKIRANYVIQNGRRYGLLGTKNCVNVSDSVFSL